MLNLPRNDTALANVGAEPAYANKYDCSTFDYSSFIGTQHFQLCTGARLNDNARLKRVMTQVGKTCHRAIQYAIELNESANKFRSPFEIQQGILSHACQEPVEVPYDLLLSVPVDTAGMDDVVQHKMMCHFRTLTTGSPADVVSDTHIFS